LGGAPIWPPNGAAPHLDDDAASALMERVREQVRALRPVDDGQKWLRDQALTINENLLRDRWLMIGDQGRNVSPIMLGVPVSWVTLIFVGFGINAPRNAMVAASFLICAVVIGGATMVVYESMANGQVVLITTELLDGRPPVRSVYFSELTYLPDLGGIPMIAPIGL
jgi:hypothetical protein